MSTIEPGELCRTYTVKCSICLRELTISTGTKIDGRWKMYRSGVEWQLRNEHGWGVKFGKWICGQCLQEQVGR